jgi:hypothetical protein
MGNDVLNRPLPDVISAGLTLVASQKTAGRLGEE